MEEDTDPMLDGRPISEMKVVELKEELKKRGLSKVGNKNVLHERLREFLLADKSAKDESEKSVTASESSRRDLASPPNPLVAEYLAKQQTALREARKDAEAVRKASSGDDSSPTHEKSGVAARRSRRERQESATSDVTTTLLEENLSEHLVTSETEQEGVEAKTSVHEDEKDEDVSTTLLDSSKKENDDDRCVTSEMKKETATEEVEHTEMEYTETKLNETHEFSTGDSTSDIVNAENISKDHEIRNEQEIRDDDNASSDVSSSGTDEETSSRSRSQSESGDESAGVSFDQATADLEEPSNTDKGEIAGDDSLTKKLELVDDSVESSDKNIKTESTTVPGKNRRWKISSEAVPSSDNVVTVSLEKQDLLMLEEEDKKAAHSSASIDFREDLSDLKDKMEELDYEEPVQSSVAEVAEEVKAAVKFTKKQKTKTAEGSIKHSEQSHLRKRSPTPEKNREAKVTVDGFVRERSVSPARYPVNQVIMIRQLTRPYTVKQLQQLLLTFGTLTEGGFWIDNIKSTCIAKYSTVEEAIVARGRLHNIVWPPYSPRALKVDYSDDANLEKHFASDHPPDTTKPKEKKSSEVPNPALRVSLSVDEKRRHVHSANQDESGNDMKKEEKDKHGYQNRVRKRSPSPVGHSDAKRPRERRSPRREERKHHPASPESKPKEPEKRVKTADELFLKTKTQPAIYYLPLTDEQVLERAKRKAAEAEMAKKVAQNGTASKRKEKDEQAKEKTSANKQQPSAKAPPSRKRSRTPPSRRRSRSPVAQRDRRHSRSRSSHRRR